MDETAVVEPAGWEGAPWLGCPPWMMKNRASHNALINRGLKVNAIF
jgi:hypothetical protein